MEFKLESRTADWFALAQERGLQENMDADDVGSELRQLGSEQNPAAILKIWESRGLIAAIQPTLERRHPDYDLLGRIVRSRDELMASGLRPRLFAPVILATLGKLKPRERAATLSKLGFRNSEINAVMSLEHEVDALSKMLAGRKTAQPGAAFAFLEKIPADWLVFALAGGANSKSINKIRTYLRRWRPLRQGLPAVSLELEAIGMPRGPKFDKVMEAFFQAQLLGKGRTPEEVTKLLRKLSGIKEPPPPKEEKKKLPEKGKKKPSDREEALSKLQPKPAAKPPAAKPPVTKPADKSAKRAHR
jgi:hypothetical protein